MSSTQINLAWPAATDNVGVTGYRVERCQGGGCSTFAQVGAATTLSYSDTTVAASTSYTYRVRAVDAAGNLGPYSSTTSATTPAAVPIAYVQSAFAVPQTPQAVVVVAFGGVQSAGNLNVVAVGWNDATSQVLTVTDARGNIYTPALTTVQPGIQSHALYYAANVTGAATNAVTVTFNTAVSYPDVRIAEYRGIDPGSPLIGASGASGMARPPTVAR